MKPRISSTFVFFNHVYFDLDEEVGQDFVQQTGGHDFVQQTDVHFCYWMPSLYVTFFKLGLNWYGYLSWLLILYRILCVVFLTPLGYCFFDNAIWSNHLKPHDSALSFISCMCIALALEAQFLSISILDGYVHLS